MFRMVIGFLLILKLCSTVASAGVALGTTRIVYPSDQKQVSLSVINSDEKSGFLIQSWIENEKGEKDTRFIMTPPLFVMNGKKENKIRIIDATSNSLSKNKETLFWVNVKAIPSLDKSRMSENILQLAITSRIKLFYRPLNLDLSVDEAYKKLTFHRNDNFLVIKNPTPYYITISDLSMGNRKLDSTMVAPLTNAYVDLPKGTTGDIAYKTINDFGAVTPVIKTFIQ
ncbi:fimbria/pilus periplasmic chaperone [Providencia rettgeri]